MGEEMSYAVMLMQVRRAALRIEAALDARRVPANADLKMLGLQAQMFERFRG